MIHNETINIWSHLIGVFIFAYLVWSTYDTYQPNDFYYQNIMNNMASKNKLHADFGVKFSKFEELKSSFTN